MTDLLSQPGATVDPRDLRAQEAVRIFRGMQAGMTGFARALTGNKRVTVELATGTPRTDGSKIYLKPPIELGDKYTHKRKICDKRDPVTGTLLCFACKAREEVIVALYHEIGHIAGGTFDPPSQSDQVTAIENSIEAYGSKWAAKLKKKIEYAPSWQTGDFLNLSSLVSPFLPIIVNSLEDTRVDNKMFKARKGTKVMFDAWVQRTFADGVEQPDGSMKMWNEYPLNSQAMIGLFIVSCKYNYEGWFAPEVEEALGDEKLNDLLARMDTVKSVRGVYELAFPLLARLKELGFCREPQDDFEEEDDQPTDEPEDSPEASEDDSESEPDGEGDESDDDESGVESSDDGHGSQDEDGTSEDDDSDDSGDEDDSSDVADEPDDEGTVDDSEDHSDGSESDVPDDGAGDSDSDGAEAGEGSSGDPGSESGGSSDREQPLDNESGQSDSDVDVPETDDEADPAAEPEGSSSGSPGSAGGAGDEGEVDDPGDDAIPDESDGVPPGSGATEPSERDDGPAEPADEGGSPETSDGGVDPESDDDGSTGEGEGPTDSDAPGEPSGGEPSDEGTPLDSDGSELPTGQPEPGSPDVLGSPEESDPPQPAEQPDPSGGEGDEPVDTGADEGMGGVKDDSEPKDWGSADEAGEIVKVFGHHDKVIPTPETYEDELNDKALDAAIVQGLYFEKPSAFIRGVRTHKYGKPIYEDGKNQSVGWPSIQDQDAARRRGVLYDTEVDEAILGPALLETRRTFADNARRGRQNNLKSGRVNRRVLGKRAPVEDPRLFAKTRLPKRKSYAVGIGIDISGSTYGLNIALAKRAARAQAELCHRVGIPFAVWAHTAQYPASGFTLSKGLTLDIYEVKGFDEPWDVKAIEALSMLGSAHENLDGHGIEYYRRELERVDATDHILMYYTDGKMPAANHDEELEVLQREIRYFKQRQMTLMGVGIRTDSPRRHGLDTVQVDTDEDLIKVVRHLEKKLVHANR